MSDKTSLIDKLTNIEYEVKKLEKSKNALETIIQEKQKELSDIERVANEEISKRKEELSKKEFETEKMIQEKILNIQRIEKDVNLRAAEYSTFEAELKDFNVSKKLFEDEKKMVEELRVRSIDAENKAKLLIDQYNKKLQELNK